MDITFRTLGPWGGGKGSNLQPSEVDANFWSIAQAIVDLQENPSLPNGIASITVSGTQMTIYLNDGSVMGPFTLPVLTFRWRGEWTPNTNYTALDVVTVDNVGIFMVQISHISGASFSVDFAIDGQPVYLQLFGSTNAALSGLSDVLVLNVQDHNILEWDANDQVWVNLQPGDMLYQWSFNVRIDGGSITGMPAPVNPSDVATKAYVDALPTGATSPHGTVLSNISGAIAPAIPNTLSDVLDAVLMTTVRGTLLYRSGTGWSALPPGASGYFLKTLGMGNDPVWDVGGSGVTSITAGTGISTGGAPITAAGVVSLQAIPDSNILANSSGAAAAPVPTTLTAYLDHVLTNARGTILTRASAGWVGLAPGTNGHFLKTQGSGADAIWDAPAGSGTVTSITAGPGITTGGSPITGSGTVSLATIANLSVLANLSGAAAAPLPTTISLLFDATISATQGTIIYRSATGWVGLPPGTSGQVLTTAGASSNPSWANAPASGGSIQNGRVVANISGSTAVPVGQPVSDVFDSVFSSSRGAILYRSNTGWVALAPGTTGQLLQTGGASGNPSWVTNSGGSIAITSPKAQDEFSYNTSSGKFENVRPAYNIGTYVPGLMTAAQNLLYHRFSKAVSFPANLGPYLGHSTVAGVSAAPAASTAITLARASAASPTVFATFATITIAAGAFAGSMSTQALFTFFQGDTLRIRAPATPDATAADFFMTLVGFES